MNKAEVFLESVKDEIGAKGIEDIQRTLIALFVSHYIATAEGSESKEERITHAEHFRYLFYLTEEIKQGIV